MKALLIIDMQKESFNPYSSCHDTMPTIERINFLSRQFRANHYPVIFIQHDGTKENCFFPNSEEWEILPELVMAQSDIVVSKTANDSFYNSGLQAILVGNNIEEVYITGSATDFCVDSTIKSALSKEYKVTVVEDGHTTSLHRHVNAGTLIDHYNWVWSEMSPTKHKIAVVKTAEIKV